MSRPIPSRGPRSGNPPRPRLLLAAALALPVPLTAQLVEGHAHELLDVTKGNRGDLFGWTVVELGDVNGDGVLDLAASAPFDDEAVFLSSTGSIFGVSGADGATLWRRAENLQSAILGYALETMDWNADGVLDVVASAPFSSSGGRVWIFSGTNGAQLALLDPSGAGDGFGCSLATGGDFDGDGLEDLAVGALGVDTGLGQAVGRVYLYARGATAPFATIDGPAAGSEFGLGLAYLGDVSVPPDGRDELVVGERDPASFFDGTARVFGFVAGAPLERYAVPGVGMGFDIIGDRIDGGLDLDGDGLGDFLVGDLALDEVKVFSGVDGSPLYTLTGDGNDAFGAGHLIEDIDHDGRADLAIGAWSSDVAVSDGGRVHLFSGASGAPLWTITGATQDRGLGCDVRGCGDLDGDGRRDLLVGSYGNGGAGNPQGRLGVIAGIRPAPLNEELPAAQPADPLLADTGGDPLRGPLVASPLEPFDLTLDCSGFAPDGLYLIQGTLGRRATPLSRPIGDLWLSGATLFAFGGVHGGGVVEAVPGGLVLPPSLALIGLEYTAQGGCSGGLVRSSNALVQRIGE